MENKNGTWTCWKLTGGDRVPVGSIQAASDVWGDELYAWMSENIDGFDIDNYECDGDGEYVAVMAKTEGLPEYGWEFKAE